MAKKNATGTLSYKLSDESQPHTFDLWIDVLSQPNQLSGTSSQSRLTRHFYPHAHMPGDIAVEGTCASQKDFQDLAMYIRNHQIAMLNQPVDETFTRVEGEGYRRLLTLSIPSEGIWIRGFIPRITLNKKGVFEPAPKFSFGFFVVFDAHSTNLYISSEIRKYFTGKFDSSDAVDSSDDHPVITAPTIGINKPLQ